MPRGRGVGRPSPLSSAFLYLLAGLIIPALLAMGLTYAHELQVVAVVLALLGVLGIFARPFWGLILFVMLLYVRPEDSIESLRGMRLTLCVSVVTLLALFLQLCLERRKPVRTPLNGLLVGFAVAVVLSTLKGDGLGDTVTAALDATKLIILAFLVLNLIRSKETYHHLITGLLICTVYLALYSLYQYFTGNALQDHEAERAQAVGLFGNPNDLADTIVTGLALALFRVITSRSGSRIIYGSMAAVMVLAVLLTHSRGGMLGLLTICSACILLLVRNKGAAVVIAALLAVGLLVGGSGRSTNFDSDEESANSRFHFWDNGIDQFKTHPLTGIGYLQFPEINNGFQAHNSFVTCFAELGVLGYVCYMGCIFHCFRRRRPSDGADVSAGRNLLAARLALAAYLVGSFWSNHAYNPIMFLLFSLPVAAAAIEQADGTLVPLTRADTHRDWLRIALLCVGLITLIQLLVLRFK